MGLRIEENFDMPDIVGRDPFKIRPCEIVEVLLVPQDRHALIIDVKKLLKVRERIGRSGLVQRLERDGYPVSPSNRHHELGFKAAFNVKMKLGLWQFCDQCSAVSHSGPPEVVLGGSHNCASALMSAGRAVHGLARR